MKYSPNIYATGLLDAVGGKKFSSDTARRFFGIVRRNGDLAKLPEILKSLEALHYKREGVTKIEVVACRDIKKEIEPELKKRFGEKSVVEFSVDKGIVGGIIIKINDEFVIDASARRRLEKLFVRL